MSMTTNLGDPGERLSSAALTQAMQAYPIPGTSDDDDDKVDLRLTYQCPFSTLRRDLRCQIKTGDSFGDWTKTKNRFRIEVKDSLRKRLRTNDVPTLLIWIPQRDEKIHYALIPALRGNRDVIYILDDSIVTPAMLFDVARRQIQGDFRTLRQSNFRPCETIPEAIGLIKNSITAVRSSLVSSIFRNLNLPNSTLQHVTRRSRPRIRRLLSADSFRFLPEVLKQTPTRIQVLERIDMPSGGRTHAISLQLLEYRRVLKSTDGHAYSLFVRIREQISFPKDWIQSLLCLDGPHRGTVQSRATIESWYLKREKKS